MADSHKDDDLKSLNSQARKSEARSRNSGNDPEKDRKEANDNKKKLKVLKDALRDLKGRYSKL